MKQSQSLSNFVIVSIKFVIITIEFKFCHSCLLFGYNNNRFQLPLHRACAVHSPFGLFDSFGRYLKVYSKYLIEWIHFVSNINKLIKYYFLRYLFNWYCWVCVNDILSDKLLIYKQKFSAISRTSIYSASLPELQY